MERKGNSMNGEIEPSITDETKARLAKPFGPSRVKKNYQGLEYISYADVIERLNEVVGPTGWSTEFEVVATAPSVVMKCHMTVLGHTHVGYGEAEKEQERFKSAEADAGKRAARCFGIGLHLWLKEPVQKAPTALPPAQGQGVIARGRRY